MQKKQTKRPILALPKECVGCSACASACANKSIVMKRDFRGFYHPSIDYETCVYCKVCESVCPVINQKVTIDSNELETYAAYSLQDKIRKESSSGGVFTELAECIIKDKGVAFGASFDSNFSVHHIFVDRVEDLRKLRGAKYSQSNLDNSFYKVKQTLDSGKKVLFSGTPCQIAGLKLYLKKQYANLLCVDFVCHGVVSTEAWNKYVQYRASIDNDGILPIYINLRDKESGWSHYKYSVHFQYENGIDYRGINGVDEFTRLYASNGIANFPCYSCRFKGLNRASDITIGDFWGIWNERPEMDCNKGVSLIICNTRTGKSALNSIREKIYFEKMSIKQATNHNSSYYESLKRKGYEDEIMKAVCEGRIEEAIKTLDSFTANRKDNGIKK